MKHLVYIGNKLSKKGKTATTIDTLGKGLEAAGFEVTYASSYSNIILRFLDMLWTVFQKRKTTDYVLIDTYSTLNFFYAYAVSKLCQWLNLKYIPILHGGNLPKRLKNNPKLSASIFNKSYINISPSDFIKSEFETFGYFNVSVIPNSISINNYSFTERSMDKVDLLWVRSFSNLYNPKLAVTILFQLKKIYPKATLCMVGPDNDGSLKTTKAYADQLGIDVTFTGKLTKKEWVALSTNYSVFINTTNFDNTPVSVIEAMALGLPIVSTNVGGLPYLIEHNSEGILVNPNHPEAFVDAIKQYKNNTVFRTSVIKQARLKAESFDWKHIKQQWLTTLK
ncbi:glycosyltransferase [Olleya sp. YS]|uniref:glycosyltransferase family 4 protein n=1 Tax=Olleya sp. YS TaxID=3028318 RepID=UPI0024341F18|nr:glycosyltransferase [Olleya sp. YS]WGD34859.1 glycosyltransferase [Olleya sp. YS]